MFGWCKCLQVNDCVVLQAPVKTNGKILRYDLNISQDNVMFKREVIKLDDFDRMRSYLMYSMELSPKKTAFIQMTAANSVGVSLTATLFIPQSNKGIV